MIRKIFFIVGFFFIYLNTWPKSLDVKIQRFTIGDGLSQTSINCIFQSPKGYLWLGTQDGLNRYDGYNFKIYHHDPLDTTSLSDNRVHSICEDLDGNLWVATRNGLCKLISGTDKFHSYFYDYENPSSLSSNYVYKVYIDKKGSIWVKTLESLDKYIPETNSFIHYKHYFDLFTFISESNLLSIYEDVLNNLWVGTKDGLNLFDRELNQFERFKYSKSNSNSISNNEIQCIYEDSKNNLWVGTTDGLNLFDRNNRVFERFYYKPKDSFGISNSVINSICEDSSGILWIGTMDGLLIFNLDTKTFHGVDNYKTKEITLNYTINSLFQDKSDILWIGTSEGLIKLDRKPLKFETIPKDEESDFKFTSNYISAIYVDNKDIVWLGTWSQGMNLYDRKNNNIVQTYTIEHTNKRYRINDNNVHQIFEDSRGDIWIGNGWGVSKFDRSLSRFVPLSKISSYISDNFFYNVKVYTIYEDHEGNFWFASLGGLHKYYYESKKLTSFYYNQGDSLGISSNCSFDVLEDNDNIIWIGTDNGLNRYDSKTGRFKRFIASNKYQPGNISNNVVYALHLDSNNDLWVGTVNGLNKFDKKTESFRIFTEKDGLPNNVIYSILEDDNKNLWFSTNRGLVKLNLIDYAITKYDVADGLQDYEFNFGACFKTNSGELFFGGIDGYNSFFPDSLYVNRNIPDISITSIEVINEDGRKFTPILDDYYVNIPADNKFFTIEFAALDFTWPEKNHYAYMMSKEGEKGEWLNIGTRRHASFSNLPPGNYTFHVKGSNNDLLWNEKGAQLNIIVDAPFWKTSKAYVFYLFLFLLSVYSFFLYRTRNLRTANQILREKELASIEIAKQKEELSIKNKNITDSINYARRIQQAILPSEKLFKKYVPNSFIFFKPRDIVSGDFYWVNKKDDRVFVAVVDCTGHGVPGAFMSLIGYELLGNITNIGVSQADEILNELNKGLVETFNKDVDGFTLKDGMDIALCVFDKKSQTLQFAGAFRPLYLIRDNTVTEIKGDRFSVGLAEEYNKHSFKNTVIPLENNDLIYIFSDGYADQFGGADGKKYKYRRFRHLLLTIHKYPLEKQREMLQESIEEWSNNHDQVDDMLIIGIDPTF